ncbi:MAG: tRNA (guanosine(46)-N7)-methyltransferase TrmB [Methylococcaceae bacterium]
MISQPRRIRSYVLRQGRITPGQQQALERLTPKYCLDPATEIDVGDIFEKNSPLIVEIGFGNGASLAEVAEKTPETNFIGIEVHQAGVGHLMLELEHKQLTNVRIICHDAIEIVKTKFKAESLDALWLFFPDPWPKKKHHKRRILNSDFIEIVTQKLKTGGYLHAATDWEPYAEQMLKVLQACPALKNQNKGYAKRPAHRPLTKFEKRGLNLGHQVRDLVFERITGSC